MPRLPLRVTVRAKSVQKGELNMRLQDYDISAPFRATVVSTERITPQTTDEVRELVLDLERHDFTAEAGQSVGVLVPGHRELGQQHHFRLYTLADVPVPSPRGDMRIRVCVRRCTYVDEYNGERYEGLASHYLCDRRPGDTLAMTGPYGIPFEIPAEPDANLILIGAGTGIAPFRALLAQMFRDAPGFRGRVWLFHGARSGLDMLYMNDERNDLSRYFDRGTFEAIAALSPRPHWTEAIDWGSAIEARGRQLWELLGDPRTRVYVAGLEKIRDELDAVFVRVARSEQLWQRRKAELEAGGRWVELLY